MLIAILTDIHGNREALSACLAHARLISVDRLIFLGDYVGYGADPAWVVDQVRGLVDKGAVALLGNHDAAIDGSDEDMNSVAREAIRWTRNQLGSEQRRFLADLPLLQILSRQGDAVKMVPSKRDGNGEVGRTTAHAG